MDEVDREREARLSIRDADVLEVLILSQAERIARPLRVLEWGAGRSTLYFSAVLETQGPLGSWLTIEHSAARLWKLLGSLSRPERARKTPAADFRSARFVGETRIGRGAIRPR
jgi:hypothetical protein